MSAIEQTLQQIRDEVAKCRQEFKWVVEASEARILLKIQEYKNRINYLERENNELRAQFETLEKRSKKNNIVVFGLENFQLTPKSISEKLNSLLGTSLEKCDISDVYNLGRSHTSPIKIEFVSHQVKISTLSKRTELKGKSVYMNHDLTKKQQEENRTLRNFWREFKEDPKVTCYIRGNKLYRNGKSYTAQELEEEEHLRDTCDDTRQHNSAPDTPTQEATSQEVYTHTADSGKPEDKERNVFEDTIAVGQEANSQKSATPKTSAPKSRTKSVTNGPTVVLKDKLRSRPQR